MLYDTFTLVGKQEIVAYLHELAAKADKQNPIKSHFVNVGIAYTNSNVTVEKNENDKN